MPPNALLVFSMWSTRGHSYTDVPIVHVIKLLLQSTPFPPVLTRYSPWISIYSLHFSHQHLWVELHALPSRVLQLSFQ